MEKRDRLTELPVVFLLALVCCFLWGSATPSIKNGYELFRISGSDTMSIILFAGIRFFIAGILVILFQSVVQKRIILPEKSSLPSIVKLSLVQTVGQYFCFYLGLAHTSGVSGTIASGAGGFFAIIMASLVFRYEKLTPAKIAGCILGIGGIVIMNISFSQEISLGFTFAGEGLVLVSQVLYALSGILVKRYSSRFSVVMLSGYQFITGGLVMIIAGLLFGGRIAIVSEPVAYILLIYMAFISAVAYTLWGTLMKHNDISRVSIFSFMTPLFGVFLSAIFLGEVEEALQPEKLVALILVSVGIYVVNQNYAGNKRH